MVLLLYVLTLPGGAIDGCASIPYLQAACLKERRIRFEVSAFGVGLASRRACV